MAGALAPVSNKLPFFCELHCLGSLLSSRSGIQTSDKTHTTHAKPPWGKRSLCSPSEIWSGMSSRPFCDGRTFCLNICSVQHLGTWPQDATEHLKRGGCGWKTERFFHTRVESLSAPRGWVTTLSCFYPWNPSSLSAHGWERAQRSRHWLFKTPARK